MLLLEIFKQRTVHNLHSMHQLITEARKTKTQTQNTADDLFRERPNYELDATRPTRDVELKRASRNQTKQETSNIRLDQHSANLLSQLDQSGLRDDRYPDDIPPRRPGTEIATRNTDIATRSNDLSTEMGEPNWHRIENLPGYMKSAIRAMGRQVFAPLTNTDIEDIDVIANVMGSGPNSDTELKLVGSYLRQNGTRDTEAELDFNRTVLQGYKADIQIWTAADKEYLTVKDHAGHYIYSWPKSDSKNFNLFRPTLD